MSVGALTEIICRYTQLGTRDPIDKQKGKAYTLLRHLQLYYKAFSLLCPHPKHTQKGGKTIFPFQKGWEKVWESEILHCIF